MRLRWITVLCALALKVALITAMLLVGRHALYSNYAALERQHVESDLVHVCRLLQAQLKELDLTAMDYAQWDGTYNYMKHPDPSYATMHISEGHFRGSEIMLFLLIDPVGRVVLAHSYDGTGNEMISADINQLIRASKRRAGTNAAVAGLITLTRGPAMAVIRPILKTTAQGSSRGTLIMVRNLGPAQLTGLSRLAEIPLTLSGSVGDSASATGNGTINHPSTEIVALGEDRLLASTMIDDVWGRPSIRLQIEHDRSLRQQGKQVLRGLVLVLLLVGLLFAFANVWIMQRVVVRRVEQLIQLTRRTETDAGLNARVHISGNDELAQLGHKMNHMLQRLQNSQEKLLATQERLRYEATHDNLTGIWNRAAAMQLLDHELDRSSREGTWLAVIMFDADHFKRINDYFGHALGDRALQAIAAAITRNLRSFDICCRYGGDEFLVIAPNCDLQQGEQLASRILASLRTTPIVVPEHSFCITMSAGVTAGRAPIKAEDLIIVADRALYRAKEKGRDRVHTEDTPAGKSAASARFAAADLESFTA
ncbi:MAG: sensor domain-containing diguanylate cyclase [Terriglobales bacterium]